MALINSVHKLSFLIQIKEKFGSKIYSKIAIQQFLLNHYLFTIKVDESKLLKPFLRGLVRYFFGYTNPWTKPFLWKALVKLKKRRARGSIMFKEQTKKKLCMASGLRSSPICSWHICFEEMRPNWASLSLSLPSKRQLLSKGLFSVIVWTKKPMKNFKDYCPSL